MLGCLRSGIAGYGAGRDGRHSDVRQRQRVVKILKKQAMIDVEYDSQQGYVWIWRGSDSLSAVEFKDIENTQRKDLIIFFGRKLSFKKRRR